MCDRIVKANICIFNHFSFLSYDTTCYWNGMTSNSMHAQCLPWLLPFSVSIKNAVNSVIFIVLIAGTKPLCTTLYFFEVKIFWSCVIALSKLVFLHCTYTSLSWYRYFVFHWSSAPPSMTAIAVQVIATPCVGGVLLRASVLGAQSARTPASQ